MKNKIVKNLVLLLAALVPLQIYFKIFASVHITLAALLAIILFIFSISRTSVKYILSNKRYFIYIALCLLFTLRLISGGDLRNGLKITYFMWLGPVVFFAVKDLDKNVKKKLVHILVLCSLPVMFISIFQAFSESFKMSILNSPIMKLFVEPDTLKEVVEGIRRNNILMPGRGGGFFVNVNIASLYFNLIICAIIYNIFNAKKISGFDIILFIFAITTVVSTGSSAGIMVSFIIFLSVFIIAAFKRIKFSLCITKTALILIVICITLISLPCTKFCKNTYKRFHNKITSKSGTGRNEIWNTSFELLTKKCLFGYGYSDSAWNDAYKKRHGSVYPPHNIFLIIWQYVGFSGLLLYACFIIFFFFDVLKKLKLDFSQGHLLGFLLILVLFLHGLTENLVFANIRIDMLFWLLVGVAET